MRLALIAALASSCGFSPGSPHGAAGDGGPAHDGGTTNDSGSTALPDAPATGPWTRRIDVTGTMVTGGPHADFPVLVSFTMPWLRAASAGGEVASPLGYDIWFSSDAAGASPLPHEVERYTPGSGELVAWVQLPMLTTATSFYIHDGDPSITTSRANAPAVWSAGYAGVWHLSGTADATAQNLSTDSGTSDVAAQIANGRGFNGTSSVISAGDATPVTNLFSTGGTAEAWIYPTGWGGGGFGRIFDKNDNTVFSTCDSSVPGGLLFGRSFSQQTGNWCTGTSTLALNRWIHVAVVYDESSASNVPTMYIDGVPSALAPGGGAQGTAASDAAGALTIGDRSTGSRAFAGTIDELQLSRVARSAGWIATTYANQLAPGSFCVVAP